jgi:hypothetical protein
MGNLRSMLSSQSTQTSEDSLDKVVRDVHARGQNVRDDVPPDPGPQGGGGGD